MTASVVTSDLTAELKTVSQHLLAKLKRGKARKYSDFVTFKIIF